MAEPRPEALSAWRWRLSHRFDRRALPIANRHYNRQTPESPQAAPNGRDLVRRAWEADRCLTVPKH